MANLSEGAGGGGDDDEWESGFQSPAGRSGSNNDDEEEDFSTNPSSGTGGAGTPGSGSSGVDSGGGGSDRDDDGDDDDDSGGSRGDFDRDVLRESKPTSTSPTAEMGGGGGGGGGSSGGGGEGEGLAQAPDDPAKRTGSLEEIDDLPEQTLLTPLQKQKRAFREDILDDRPDLEREDVAIRREEDRLVATYTETYEGPDFSETVGGLRRGAFGTSPRTKAQRDARRRVREITSAFERGAFGDAPNAAMTPPRQQSGPVNTPTLREIGKQQVAAQASDATGADVQPDDVKVTEEEDGSLKFRLALEGGGGGTENLDQFVRDLEEKTGIDVPGEGPVEEPDNALFGNADLRASDPFTEGDGSTGVGTTPMGVTLPEGTKLERSDTFEKESADASREIRLAISKFADDVIDPQRPFRDKRGRASAGPMAVTLPEETDVDLDADTSPVTGFTRSLVSEPAKIATTAPFDLPVAAKDLAELAADPDVTAGEIATAGTFAGAQAASAGLESPGETLGVVGGSLVGTGLLFKATQGTRLAGPTRGLIQPGEELAGKVGARVVPGRAGEKLFPNEEPLIFSEEAAIRGAQRVSQRLDAPGNIRRARRRGRLEAKSARFALESEFRGAGRPTRSTEISGSPDLSNRLLEEITSARFRARELLDDGVRTRTPGSEGRGRGQMTLIDAVPRMEAETKVEAETEAESRRRAAQEPSLGVEAETEIARAEATGLTVGAEVPRLSGEMQRSLIDAELGSSLDIGTELGAELGQEIDQRFDLDLETEIESETELETELELEQEFETEQELEMEVETELELEPETEVETAMFKRRTKPPKGDAADADEFTKTFGFDVADPESILKGGLGFKDETGVLD